MLRAKDIFVPHVRGTVFDVTKLLFIPAKIYESEEEKTTAIQYNLSNVRHYKINAISIAQHVLNG